MEYSSGMRCLSVR